MERARSAQLAFSYLRTVAENRKSLKQHFFECNECNLPFSSQRERIYGEPLTQATKVLPDRLSDSGLLEAIYNREKYRSTIPYLPCLHSHFSNSLVSSPFGTSLLAVFHLLEAPKFLCPAGFSIKFLIFRVSGLSSPSQITLDLCPLSAKILARA